ncbi:MAG: hypothetical protein IMZ60_05130 [Actinobacteria bacterium]|nr:hypothetical protein [Actinomycetota bacterium]
MYESYSRVLKRFRNIALLLKHSKKIDDRFGREALSLFNFPEVEGICIGYSMSGTSGSGFGPKLSKKIIITGKEIIDAGIQDPEIFEIIGLFEENVGPDRISDMIARIIYEDLIKYTRNIMEKLEINSLNCKEKNIKVIDGLLINPYNKKPLILLPKNILHELPIAHEWENIDEVCLRIRQIREEINATIGKEWSKLSASYKKYWLKKLLLHNESLFRQVIEEYKAFDIEPYDFNEDPTGEYIWHNISNRKAKNHPLFLYLEENPTFESVYNLVKKICFKFKDLVENNGLYELFYYNGKPRKEKIVQKAFYSIADSYCEANNLDLSPEVNSGRGSVDFKISKGYIKRVLVEIKLTTNNQIVHGFRTQLKEYMKAEKTKSTIFLVIDNGGPKNRIESLFNEDKIAKEHNIFTPEIIIIDAISKVSASRYNQ